MQAILYKTTSPKNAINKVLTDEKTLEIHLKDYVSILTPEIDIVNFNGAFLYNYMYIPDFSRYYFIEGITILSRNVIRLTCKVDVLETWKTDILASTCHIIKESNANMYGADIAESEERTHETQEVTGLFALQEDFILTVSRGGIYAS